MQVHFLLSTPNPPPPPPPPSLSEKIIGDILAELPRAPQGARERSPIAKRIW